MFDQHKLLRQAWVYGVATRCLYATPLPCNWEGEDAEGEMLTEGQEEPAMAKKNIPRAVKMVIAKDPAQHAGKLKAIGGSCSDDWNNLLANQVIHALWLKHSNDETSDRQFSATVAGLIGIGPKDELEGMMAAQLIAAHNAAMECYRRHDRRTDIRRATREFESG